MKKKPGLFASILPHIKRSKLHLFSTLKKIRKRGGGAASDLSIAIAYKNQGNDYANTGDLESAADCYRLAIQHDQKYAEAHNNLGFVFALQNKFDEALPFYQNAVRLNPALYKAHYNLGHALANLNRRSEAKQSFTQVIALVPDHGDALLGLGKIAAQDGEFHDAEKMLRRALEIQPDNGPAHGLLGLALHSLERHEQAVSCYQKALVINPDCDITQCNYGIALIERGEMKQAEAALTSALTINPMNTAAMQALLTLIPYQSGDSRFNQLESIYGQRDLLALKDRITLNFSMGTAMENAGQYDKSFEAYEEGNQLFYQHNFFDENAEILAWQQTMRIYSQQLFDHCTVHKNSIPAIQEERVPVFIVGMPRSGSTLLAQILSRHQNVFAAGELQVMNEFVPIAANVLASSDSKSALIALRKLGQQYLERVWKHSPNAQYIIDKLPGNFQHLGLIHLMLPNAKIVHSTRSPIDTCFSCYAQQFVDGHFYSFDLQTLGRQYLRYNSLMKYWREVLPPARILDVSYEMTVADLETETGKMLNYLGLPWDPACLTFYENKRVVRTASSTQVRRPIYSTSVDRWKPYARHLLPLLEILHPIATVLHTADAQVQTAKLG